MSQKKQHTPKHNDGLQKQVKAVEKSNHMLRELSRQVFQDKDQNLNELIDANDKLLNHE